MKNKKYFLLFLCAFIVWLLGSTIVINYYIPKDLTFIFLLVRDVIHFITVAILVYFFIQRSVELVKYKSDEQRLSTLINSMVDFVNFKDGEGRWIEANDFGLRLFQLEGVDYKNKKDSELAIYSDFYGDALRYCETSDEEAWKNEGVSRMEEVIPMPDGSVKTFDTIKVPLFHKNGSRKGLVIMGRDITERKQVELLLMESQQQYKSLFEYNPDLVYMIDLDGTIMNLNPKFQSITGYDSNQFIGKNIYELLPQELLNPVKVQLSKVISSQESQTYELEVPMAKDRTIILQCTSLPIIVNGDVKGLIGYGKDVTHIRKTEEKLRQTEKLSVVGELAASVAHEIRNPLTSLKGFVQLLQRDEQSNKLYNQIMLDELDRIDHIVGELLLLAKPQQVKFQKTSIHNLLNSVISLLHSEALLHNVEIVFSSQLRDTLIDCEPNQLKQLFINLIKNAIEASMGKGMVFVTLEKSTDEHITILIEDQGCGISKERLDKIGEPFYSSKEKGTGLGLTVSFKIVQTHNGRIAFDSVIDEGTKVQIELPIHKV